MATEHAKSVVTDEATKTVANSANNKVNKLITDITAIKFVSSLPVNAADNPTTLYLIKK